MANVRIVTDSASDMPRALLDEHHVEVVPLTIRFGDEEFTDGVDLSTADFWKRCRASAKLPETAAPAPGAFQAAYERAAADGCDGVVAVTLSSALSATYQAATLGAEAVKDRIEVHVVDSRFVTAAEGLLALDAAVFAATGATASAVADHARDTVSRAGLVGVIDTLDHLVKGGRVAGAKALVGSLLEREADPDGARRPRRRGRPPAHEGALLGEPRDEDRGGRAVRVARDRRRRRRDLQLVVDRLARVDTTHPAIVTDIGPVVGTHGGPGVVGVCWIARAAS